MGVDERIAKINLGMGPMILETLSKRYILIVGACTSERFVHGLTTCNWGILWNLHSHFGAIPA